MRTCDTTKAVNSHKAPWDTYVLLGRGGRHPGVTALDPTTGDTHDVIALPAGDSVYGMGTAPDGYSLVLGTKSGLLKRFRVPGPSTGDEIRAEVQHTFRLPRAPILDLAFLGDARIAVANQCGGCWICPLHPDLGNPYPINTDGRTVCALAAISDRVLAGLCSCGDLLIWDLAAPQSPRIAAAGPEPPPCRGLVALCLWEAQNALVYPGKSGQLVAFDMQDEHIEIINAHDHPFYALCCDCDTVMTIGKEDGLARTWARDLRPAGPPLSCPTGIIAVASVVLDRASFVLVGESGSAAAYSCTPDSLQRTDELVGSDYRIVRSACKRALAISRSDEVECRASAIAHELCGHIASANDSESAPLHIELNELGFPHVSLAIKIEVAQHSGLYSDAVTYASIQLELLSKTDTTKSRRSLLKCADLLETVWLLQLARQVRRRAMGRSDDDSQSLDMQRLLARAGAMDGEKWIACPDIPIPDIASCATAIGEPFRGRWLLRQRETLPCPGMSLSPSAFVRRYNSIYTDLKRDTIPRPHAVKMQVVTRHTVQEEQVIVFGTPRSGRDGALQYCLRLQSEAEQTIATPCVVYAVPACPVGLSAAAHNECMIEQLAKMSTSKMEGRSLGAVHERAVSILRRMVSAPRRRQGSVS